MDIVTLAFVNRDSTSASTSMKVDRSAVEEIARWYGGFCGGDDYDVLVDGEIVEKDVDGEIGAFRRL